MDEFHRLGTKRSTGLNSESNASFVGRFNTETKQSETAAGEGYATRTRKKLKYKDQMQVKLRQLLDETNKAAVTTSKNLPRSYRASTKITRNSRNTILVSSAARREKSSRNKSSSVVIQVRRIYSERMSFVETKVDIKGRLLLEELKSFHEDTRGVFLGDSSNTVREPYYFPLTHRITRFLLGKTRAVILVAYRYT
jgi:hypothetical protein